MMVTLRAYSNPTDVLIAKARLDDHAIACAVADELAHLYGGAPFAMPIRLLVREEDVAEATRVLAELDVLTGEDSQSAGDGEDSLVDPLIEDAAVEPKPVAADGTQAPAAPASSEPWEILVIALMFLVPGVGLLLNDRHVVLLPPRDQLRSNPAVIPPVMTHILALIPIAIAVALTVLYFRTRAAIRQDQAARIEVR